MVWVKFDDRFPKHRRIRKLSDAAFRMHVSAICYSSEYLLDGHIAPDDLDEVADVRKPEQAASDLVRAGRWHLPEHSCESQYCYPISDGWLIHNYLEFNPSREKVEAERAREADRKRRGRTRQSGQSPSGVREVSGRTPDGIPAGIQAESDGPVPSRPVLVPPTPTSGGRSCTRHGRPRRGCQACETPANPTVIGPSCGNCSPSRRLENADGTDAGPCPSCHPSTRSA